MTVTEPTPDTTPGLDERSQPGSTDTDGTERPEELVEAEVLVEEISIDGMCGVY